MTKVCSKCKLTKSLVDFGKNKSTKDGLHCYCKQCHKEKASEARKADPEKARATLRASYQRNKDKREEYRAAYRADPEKQAIEQAYREKYSEANKDKINEYNAYYRSTYDGKKIRLHHQNLRTERIQRATPAWADLEAIKRFYQNCPEGHEVDHIIPLQGKTVCGLHTIENLQYLPSSENRRKSNKLEE